MDERQIGLALTLKELGVSGEVSDFDSRLILQKTVYLIEEAGIKLGYPFNWYLRGPYLPALTRDLFDLASSDEDVAEWVLDGKSKEIAKSIAPLISGVPGEEDSAKVHRLELLASLRYLSRRRRVNLDDAVEATEQLVKNGKHFSEGDVAVAIQKLKEIDLL